MASEIPALTLVVMGFYDNWKRQQRIKQAAKEMWAVVRVGKTFEVPFAKNPNDLATLAVMQLQKDHPEVRAKIHQSRGVVIGLHASGAPNARNPVSDAAWQMLAAGGYNGLDGKQLKEADVEANLDAHIAWMRSQGLDPDVAEKESQEAEMKKYAVELRTTDLNQLSSAQRAQRLADEVYEREVASASPAAANAAAQSTGVPAESDSTP